MALTDNKTGQPANELVIKETTVAHATLHKASSNKPEHKRQELEKMSTEELVRESLMSVMDESEVKRSLVLVTYHLDKSTELFDNLMKQSKDTVLQVGNDTNNYLKSLQTNYKIFEENSQKIARNYENLSQEEKKSFTALVNAMNDKIASVLQSNERLDSNIKDVLTEWKSDVSEIARSVIEGVITEKTDNLCNKIDKSVNGANKVLEAQKGFVNNHSTYTKGFKEGLKAGKVSSMVIIAIGICIALFALWTVKKETDFDRYNAEIQKSAQVAEQNNQLMEQIVNINSENLSKYVNCYFSGFDAEKLYYWTVYNNSQDKFTLTKNFNEWLQGYETFDQNKWLNTLNDTDKQTMTANMRNLGIISQEVGHYMKQLNKDASFWEKAGAFMKDYGNFVAIAVFLIVGFAVGGYCQENTKIKIWK